MNQTFNEVVLTTDGEKCYSEYAQFLASKNYEDTSDPQSNEYNMRVEFLSYDPYRQTVDDAVSSAFDLNVLCDYCRGEDKKKARLLTDEKIFYANFTFEIED